MKQLRSCITIDKSILFFCFIVLTVSCDDEKELPLITTIQVSDNALLGQIITGSVIPAGYEHSVNEFGVCWSKEPHPTSEDNVIRHMPNNQTSIKDLSSSSDTIRVFEPNTVYYIRAYAKNEAGVAYGMEYEAIQYVNYPLDDITDIEGNVYHTIRLGEQVWTVENLRTTKFNNGDAIPNIEEDEQWLESSGPYLCDYGNEPSLGELYGKLYNQKAITDERNLTPVGWKIPNQEDWLLLRRFLNNDCNNAMAQKSLWLDAQVAATNITGFSALPNGKRDFGGRFERIGHIATWWVRPDVRGVFHAYIDPDYENSCLQLLTTHNFTGCAIRCIKE